MVNFIEKIINFGNSIIIKWYQDPAGAAILLTFMIVAFYPLLVISKKLILSLFNHFVSGKEYNSYVKLCKKYNLNTYLYHNFISIYLTICIRGIETNNIIPQSIIYIKDVALFVYTAIFATLTLISLVNISLNILDKRNTTKKIPIGLYFNMLKTLVIICAVLIILSRLLNMPIGGIFASIGAALAFMSFVFKDVISGIVSSIQLTFQDLIRVGDYITISANNVEGTVEDINMMIVKIRNPDCTLTVLPTSSLLLSPIINSRGMHEAGGRRIQRSISLDMYKVKVYKNQEELDKLAENTLFEVVKLKYPKLFDVKNHVTNLTIFRKYLVEYLSRNDLIHHEGALFRLMVRQLAPTSTGIPMEVYIFTTNTDFASYEEIQASIFEHILGILPLFDLRVFQSLSENVIR